MDLDQIPTSKEEVQRTQYDFPRLPDDSPAGCPCSMADIRKYLKAEAAPKGTLDLMFGRTARVGDVAFWVWGYIDDGETYYVDVSARGGESVVAMGLGEGLTVEQYVAMRFARSWRSGER